MKALEAQAAIESFGSGGGLCIAQLPGVSSFPRFPVRHWSFFSLSRDDPCPLPLPLGARIAAVVGLTDVALIWRENQLALRLTASPLEFLAEAWSLQTGR